MDEPLKLGKKMRVVDIKKRWMGEKPYNCQMNSCGKVFELVKGEVEFVDGKTRYGPWAIMCVACHEKHGVGLGTGRGQKYNLETLEKVDG